MKPRTGIEKGIVLVMIFVVLVYFFSFALIREQTRACRGLKGVVEMVWTGEPCQ